MFSCFIFGFIAHGFCYSNYLVNHDSIIINQYQSDVWWKISIGRFAQIIYLYIRKYFNIPWLIGILQLLFLSLQSILIVKLLGIKNRYNMIIASAIQVTNYQVALVNATYIHEADVFAFSQLLAVFAVYILIKMDNKSKYLLSILILVFSMGLYQASIQITLTMIILVSIRDILTNKDYVLKKTICMFVVVAVGCVFYYLCSQLALMVTNTIQSNGYNSINNIESLTSTKIINNLLDVICYEKDWIFSKLSPYKLVSVIINMVVIATMLVRICDLCMNNKIRFKNIIILTILVLITPICAGLSGIISGTIHDLMVYSLYLMYIFSISLFEIDGTNMCIIFSNKLVKVLLTINIFIYCVFSNVVYLKKQLLVTKANAFFAKLINTIENTDGYHINETPVVFVGNISENPTIKNMIEFQDLKGVGTEYNFLTTSKKYDKEYLNNISTYPINYDNDENFIKANKNFIKNMPQYPLKGSIIIYKNKIIVKLSEE